MNKAKTNVMSTSKRLTGRRVCFGWLVGIFLIFFLFHASYTLLGLTLPRLQLFGSLLVVVSIPVSVVLGSILPLRGFSIRSLLMVGCAMFLGIMAAYLVRQQIEGAFSVSWVMLWGNLALNLAVYALMSGLTLAYIRGKQDIYPQASCPQSSAPLQDQQLDAS